MLPLILFDLLKGTALTVVMSRAKKCTCMFCELKPFAPWSTWFQVSHILVKP